MHCSNKFLQNYITLCDLFIFEKKIIFIILNGMYIFFFNQTYKNVEFQTRNIQV